MEFLLKILSASCKLQEIGYPISFLPDNINIMEEIFFHPIMF